MALVLDGELDGVPHAAFGGDRRAENSMSTMYRVAAGAPAAAFCTNNLGKAHEYTTHISIHYSRNAHLNHHHHAAYCRPKRTFFLGGARASFTCSASTVTGRAATARRRLPAAVARSSSLSLSRVNFVVTVTRPAPNAVFVNASSNITDDETARSATRTARLHERIAIRLVRRWD